VAESLKTSDTVEFAQLQGKVAVLRLVGRCSFQNSANLEKAAAICESEIGPCSFILDLDRCEYMDSTFLGTLAGIALRQKRQARGSLIAVNVPPPIRRTMALLGLTHVLDLRERRPEGRPDEEVEVAEAAEVEMSRPEQVARMIEAHRRLMEIDQGNEVRFKDVLKYLTDSLDRARTAEKKDETT
jgi:anti-anti-sigma factor